MNLLEREVIRNEQRIKKIADNPTPGKLKSNKLFFECQRDLRVSQLDAWRNGKPVAYYVGGFFEALFRALGCEIIDKELIVNRIVGYPEILKEAKNFLISN